MRELGGLDVLVCNAGVVHISPVEKLAEEAFDLTMAVNVKGVFLCCKAAIPVLRGRPGASIINVASVAGKNGAPGMAHYCASKFAVVGFTNSLAKELARIGVRANAICPGILRTQMWEYLTDEFRQKDEDREVAWQRYVRTLIPLGRPQTPGGHRPARRLPGHRPQRHRPGHQRRRRHGAALRAVGRLDPLTRLPRRYSDVAMMTSVPS